MTGDTRYTVEYAKNSRSQCKGSCKTHIQEGVVRFGTLTEAGQGSAWRHIDCITPLVASHAVEQHGSIEKVEGFNDLKADDKESMKATIQKKLDEQKAKDQAKADKEKEKEERKATREAAREARKAYADTNHSSSTDAKSSQAKAAEKAAKKEAKAKEIGTPHKKPSRSAAAKGMPKATSAEEADDEPQEEGEEDDAPEKKKSKKK